MQATGSQELELQTIWMPTTEIGGQQEARCSLMQVPSDHKVIHP